MRTSRALRGQGIFCSAIVFAGILANAFAASPVASNRSAMELADRSLPPLQLTTHIVDAVINGRVARVSTDSVYHNSSPRDLEAIYVLPLPDGATVEKFVMWMDGQPVEGKVAEKNRARSTYEGIVSRKKDPGLVEQVSENLFRFRIYPVKANGDQRIRIEYSQVLPVSGDSNTLTFNYPLPNTAPRDIVPGARNFLVNIALEMESSIAKLESPTHKISQRVMPGDAKRGTVSVEEAQSALDLDFTLRIALKDRALPVTSLAYRPARVEGQPIEDGTLMLFITPQLPANEEPPAKDVVMVMDTSGSMEGVKIEQARNALIACLDRLNPKDRFAIISFSDFTLTFSEKWSGVSVETLSDAKSFVTALVAAGGTNLGEALDRATKFPAENGRLKQVLFATDGLPSVGEHDPVALCKIASKDSTLPQRIHTFGIGYDVNTTLLDRIAAESRGERAYVRQNESIVQKISTLIDKISTPVLTDVTIEFAGVAGIEQVFPPKGGDLYLGQQLVLTARFKKAGAGQVVLKGKRNGKEIVIEAPLNLPESTAQATAFIPKQWAVRKTGFLLDQMRLYGENIELKNEVVRLGTQFGIVTPYTSYLALEAPDRKKFDDETNNDRALNSLRGNAQITDHFETTNLDRPDTQSAFGNPDAKMFHSVKGSDDAGGGGIGGADLLDLIGASGLATPGTGGGWGGGDGSGIGLDKGTGRGSFGNRNGGGRRLMIKRHGGSRATENSVDSALRWLAYHQEAEGQWDSRRLGSAEKIDTAVTSLALLAFLGAGHTEKVGEYKDNVKRAVAWLKSRQLNDGRVSDTTDSTRQFPDVGVPEALAAFALAEAAGMANIPDTRAAAQRVIQYCVFARTPGSGWGYTKHGEPNLIATTWFLAAMKSAKVAGLQIDIDALDGGLKFLDSMQRGGKALTFALSANDDGEDFDAPRTAMGAFMRCIYGTRKEDLEECVAGFVQRGGLPQWDDKLSFNHLYFGSLCCFQQGGETWKKWNERVKAMLTLNQSKIGDTEGSWHRPEACKNLGRAGQTAMATLCLEVYYRYMQLTPDGNSIYIDPANPGFAPKLPNVTIPQTGKEAVDYSEYIRRLKDGEQK